MTFICDFSQSDQEQAKIWLNTNSLLAEQFQKTPPKYEKNEAFNAIDTYKNTIIT